jgi:hypothetical protein
MQPTALDLAPGAAAGLRNPRQITVHQRGPVVRANLKGGTRVLR